MSKVVLIRCESYDINTVKEAVKKGMNLIGGMSAFASPNEKIVIKPNWIMGASPGKAATTHPAVFRAVAELLKKNRRKNVLRRFTRVRIPRSCCRENR